ncbi:stage V sporulation protein D (sporulation-specific penicillin-binding protein) [Clostridium moniliforme]|uniref:Stage V sporulation protein D (Sporulation-specific penicillin-binding protein) n=1 Tax=Clostridium moniliforme TaxID=39489 RepID=A0ABS4F0E5_9CLOT|nr:stage V sporulation protein D [Clostridium moniliforme]MBP1889719.1 stage V sporulation protein D (sporulation-specific penicillin-binding protein) [Clostridium moniliforme]
MKKRNFIDRALSKKRMRLIICVLTIVFAILALRLSYIMIVKRQEYAAKAEEQWTSEVKIDARRGRILDRNGAELAVSANVYRIDFDLNSIRAYLKDSNKTNAQIAPEIAKAVGMKDEDVLKKLETKLPSGAQAGSATLIRRIEKDEADKVKALKIRGIIVSPDTKRYYPNNNFAAHLLGSTNIDGQGLTGVELQYNKELSGIPGMRIAELDSKSNDLPYTVSKFVPPVEGKDVSLTIDENIQFFAEKAAEKALKDNKAKAASVLVMNPKNGEILAMVNKPDFNPNEPFKGADAFKGKTEYDKVQKMWRNRLVNDTFEPGSIFKVITAIAGMEEKVVKPTDTFVCNGYLTFGKRKIKCWKTGGHGKLTFPEIIQNSCNVGFMELGKKLGKEKLYEYINKFGFGKKCGIDLPGEAPGIVKNINNVSATDLATIAFGQTNTVNSVQYMAAFNAIANGGELIEPHVMKEITHKDDSGVNVIDEKFEPTKKKVADKETTAELRTYLERVVTSGSAKGTFIKGYHIGGKTGTAQKVNPENGTYEAGKYISSFVGMAPVNDPKITVMITIDEPSNGNYYAGVVTGPVAKTLFTDIFNYLEGDFSKENKESIIRDAIIPEIRGKNIEEAKKILKESNLDYNVEGNGKTITNIKPYPGYSVKEGTKITLYTEGNNSNKEAIVMPDVRGYSKEAANKLLIGLGLYVKFEGEGKVTNQSVPSGELINKGTNVKLTLNSDYKD